MENKDWDNTKKEIDDRFIELYDLYMVREIETITELAKIYGTSRNTIYRMIEEYESDLKKD